MPQTYSPPVANLLNYQQCEAVGADEWPNYVSEFGFTDEHIPDLLTLMQDEGLYTWEPETEPPPIEGLDPEVAWSGPIHAWRALGQLGSLKWLEGAIPVINSGLVEWAMAEFPDLARLTGPPTIDPLEAIIKENVTQEDQDVNALIEALFRIPEKYPEERDRCVAILQDALQTYQQNPKSHNSLLAIGLLELQATEAVDLIEAAYQAKAVDELLVGTWARVQIDLGLKTAADFTPEELKPEIPPEIQQIQMLLETFQRQQKPDAFELGMPIDPAAYPSTKPPAFDDMLRARSEPAHDVQKGFGGAKPTKKKGKKKKK